MFKLLPINRALRSLLLVTGMVLGLTLSAQAQNYYILSSRPNADSSEYFYQKDATLYMTVFSQSVDFNNMEKMKWELERKMNDDHGKMGDMGNHFEGSFTNNMDGSFSSSFDLSQLPNGGTWKWKAKLEDRNKNKVQFEANITYMYHSDDSSHQYLEIRGEITAINGDTLFIGKYAFVVDGATVIMGHNDGLLTLSDLQVGDYVEVEGQGLYDHVYLARKVKLEDHEEHDGDHEMEIKGIIESVSDISIVVNGMAFQINDQTQILDQNKALIPVGNLAIGMLVEVKAQMMNGERVALKIKIEGEDHESFMVELKGFINSLASDYLVIDNQRIYFDSTTVVKTDDHMMGSGSIDDLQPGQFVEVKATINTDGTLLARKIKIEDVNERHNKVTVKGVVDSVGSDFLMVAGRIILVNDSTEITGMHHQSLNFSDLRKGQVVKVKGQVQNDGTILALSIKVKELWSKYVEFKGAIESMDSNGFTLQGVHFAVDSNTVFLDQAHQFITFADLKVGDFVEVKAKRLSDGSFLALRVALEDMGRMHLEVTGEIQALTADSIRVNNLNFAIDSLTIVYNLQDSIVQISELKVGQIVSVKAALQQDGTYRALKIEIEYDPALVSVTSSLGGKSESSVIVQGTEYVVNANTVILDSSFNEIDYASLTPGSEVTVWAVSSNSGYEALQIQSGSTASVTGIQSQAKVITSFKLEQNYPNPFNPTTTIEFSLNHSGFEHVSLTIYNVLGKKVKTLYNGVLDHGMYRFEWNGTNQYSQPVASGIYFYRLQVNNQAIVKRMTLLK